MDDEFDGWQVAGGGLHRSGRAWLVRGIFEAAKGLASFPQLQAAGESEVRAKPDICGGRF
jgi:hypothetical protein